ncbi:MAG: S9 family peptidase [Bacteroidales bacterium]|nr:S9 family peptidase [Bacteroidales bacterium]MCF8327296.1 S9 family peptidase [Bacteroidales bacterium]
MLAALFISMSACDQDKKEKADDQEKAKAESESEMQKDVMSAELLWKLGRVNNVQLSPDGGHVLYGVTRYKLEENSGQNDLFKLNLETEDVTRLTTTEEASESGARWRPDGNKIGFLAPDENDDMQLWEMNPDGSDKRKISDIKNGIKGFEYAPDQTKVLYVKEVKMDKTANEVHEDLPKANARIIDNLMYRHWDEWHDYRYSHVFFADYDGKILRNHKDIMKGEKYDSPLNPWGGMEQITWNPNSDKIAYVCKKMSKKEYTLSTNSEIYLYDVKTEETKNLTKDGFEGYDRNPVYSPDGNYLAWESMEEDGFESDKNRIMVMNLETEDVTNMSKDFDYNAQGFSWSKDGKKMYFISGVHATQQIFELDVENNVINQITEGKHNYLNVNTAGDRLIGAKQSMALPTEIFAVDMEGKEKQLTHVNDEKLDKITLAHSEERWIETSDGKEMLVWVIYPPNFDKDKEYPALLYAQGGPQSAVSQFFSYRWNFQMMAANDYIVVAPNRRGLPSFGEDWNDQISGDYGGQNIKDYMTAINTVAKEDYVDEDRLGAVGASYGGYSVFYLAGKHPETFECFISHCGMFNLESQYGATEEYWFVNKDLGGPYWQEPKPKSYTEFSPHLYVDNWDTPIMIITGANDFRIPYTESLQAFNAAQLQDVPSKLLFFPEESHFVLQPQNSVLWHREFYGWLDKYLKK